MTGLTIRERVWSAQNALLLAQHFRELYFPQSVINVILNPAPGIRCKQHTEQLPGKIWHKFTDRRHFPHLSAGIFPIYLNGSGAHDDGSVHRPSL